MALTLYRKKRNFDATPEPRGEAVTSGQNNFVVQKHDARRLHYDFRLELDGVLKSWAVTKGPSLDPAVKRLAVAVEDHPLEYGDFEGTIPKGEYGGGTVIVWDRGTWRPDGDPQKGFAKGHLEFELFGKKLHGRWHLVRMATKPKEKHENWLLIKGDDEAARPEKDGDILVEQPDSAKTGRDLAAVAKEARGWSSKSGKLPAPIPRDDFSKVKGAKKAKMPGFVEPALASLVASPPSGERWLHEIKFDGYRLQARIEAGQVTLLTRSGLDWTRKFGDRITAALHALPFESALLDGEIVVENGAGASDFSALQSDLSENRSDRFIFYLFDVLYLDGFDLRDAPLIERKALLKNLLPATGPQRFSDHFEENGALALRHVCRMSLEGIVSKLRDAPYRSGRGKSWTKSKCSARQEFVIGGYVMSSTSRKAIGSLVLGAFDKGALDYVGRVGTGFTQKMAAELFARLDSLQTKASPFAQKLSAEESRQVVFVQPKLVAEIEFRAWTADGHLRHAAYRGLREDKPATSVIRETLPPRTPPKEPRRMVKLTHPDRLYWPDAGVTKEGLADYYAEIFRFAAPFIVGRPLALLRCPDGIDGQQFFQKHPWKGMGLAILPVEDPNGETAIAIKDLDGMISLAQGAALEIHPWGSTLADWERPDILIMDLDPGDGVAWEMVIAAAREIRERLHRAGLTAFVKTSGGKGLHVAAPLQPQAEWPALKTFAKSFADAMAADSPEAYVSTIPKARRQGKILIDYLRNQRGATAIAAYGARARPGAPVSMPLDWEELSPAIGPAHFTIANAPTRLASLSKIPWENFREAAAPIDQGRRRAKRKA
jgi:bifunctional non-homologous end joining protein LigD